MSKLNHTQLPWELEDDEDSCYTSIGHYDDRGIMSLVVCRMHGIDDAEFIIRACNAHYDLLGALKLATSILRSVPTEQRMRAEKRAGVKRVGDDPMGYIQETITQAIKEEPK